MCVFDSALVSCYFITIGWEPMLEGYKEAHRPSATATVVVSAHVVALLGNKSSYSK